jgi:hypothetical protein
MDDITIESFKEPDASLLFSDVKNATLSFSLFEIEDTIDTLKSFDTHDCKLDAIHLVFNNDLDKEMFTDVTKFNIKSLRSDSVCAVISEQVFHGVENLESLALVIHDQVPIEKAPFRNLTKLKCLDLDIKEIKLVKTNVFDCLQNLEELRVSVRASSPVRLQPNVFKSLTSLKKVSFF